ncbi:MAG: ABC transporter substrate-binding protein [Thaumarchaeota archaeon]|nr:ABC transporter substrate-binding protein [Nitrososphaerota archaeon]MBI3641119.1 ABC transporter substrate-binding protein [Nitrososphaerota archaeon]
MNPLLVLCGIVFVFGFALAFADKGTYVDKIQFIQYSDDNTALEEVKHGNLDIYYSPIPFDRIADPQSREGLKIFQSTGQSYSLLVNPAPSEKFNPFSIKDVRFALNYLVDRNLIIDELLGGYGVPMVSAYRPFDPDYLLILSELESLNIRYNPALAEQMISDSLTKAGAQKIDNKWYYDSKPIKIVIFIRSDDQIRKSIGEIISSQLEKIGFSVKRDYGDLNKAFTIVYGSNPSDLKWNIYTEGWASSGFVRYDSVLTAQMYSPWFSNMPGFNNPSYWNYKDDYMNSISQNIFTGNFTSTDQRTELLKKAVDEGIKESVRIFLVSKIDQYVSNKKVAGIINDFGAGITSRFTPINARDNSDSLTIGVKKIYQGAWNPVAGFSDSASQQILGAISDPGSFKNPYTGVTIPIRSSWKVETAGPAGKLDVPSDAIKWDPTRQKWIQVGNDIKSTSKVTFHLTFGNWHNDQPMDMNDVLYSIYFLYQWGVEPSENSKTFDSEYSPKANQAAKTLIGIRVIDKNTIEVYQDYWHFDEDEIADSAGVFPSMPWEIFYAMEKSVTDGKVAFSRSEAVSKNVDWLSLLVPNDADMIKLTLEDFSKSNSIPVALTGFDKNPQYYSNRYSASVSWIEKHNHAVISNGPFYLDSYSPEARIITIKAFDDSTYPFGVGYWKKFENINVAKINSVDVPTTVSLGKELTIPISVTSNCTIYYYFLNADGKMVDSGILQSDTGNTVIVLPKEKTSLLSMGANDLKIFAVSESALKPDIFHTSFLGIQGESPKIPEIVPESGAPIVSSDYVVVGIVLATIVIGIVMVLKKRKKP